MTAKEYLSQAKCLDEHITSLISELADWRSISTSVQGCRFTPNYNPNHPHEAPFVGLVTKIVDKEHELDEQIDRLVDLKIEISRAIDKLDDVNERLLLRYRYLENRDWDDICSVMQISRRTAFRIHGEAHEKISVEN